MDLFRRLEQIPALNRPIRDLDDGVIVRKVADSSAHALIDASEHLDLSVKGWHLLGREISCRLTNAA